VVVIPSEEAVKKVFRNTDRMWLEAAGRKEPRIEDGSTALCVALEGAEVMVANCGDCRAILCQGGQTIGITRDHKPTDQEEQQRIINHGGNIIGGRLEGQLAVSRAFGNYEFKESQILSAEPEIHQITLSPDIEYLVIGSDGLYEHFSNEEIISFIKGGLNNQNNNNLETVVKDLVEEAIDRGSEDNITILVVKFEKGFKKLLKKRSKKQVGKGASLLGGKSSLKTSATIKQSPPDSPRHEPKSSGLFKKGLRSGKNSSNPLPFLFKQPDAVNSPSSTTSEPQLSPKKKIIDSNSTPAPPTKKISKPLTEKSFSFKFDEEKLNRFAKPFKYDFFGSRTPVTISG